MKRFGAVLAARGKRGIFRMIIQNTEMQTETKQEMRGGNGQAVLLHVTPAENLNEKGRMFSQITLAPGCSIGYHEHHGESELFYILEGEGLLSDNGAQTAIHAGDCAICPDGQGHSIANSGTGPLVFMALILYAGGK